MTAYTTVSVSLTAAEHAAEIEVRDHSSTCTPLSRPMVALCLGEQVFVYLRDPAVLDALDKALIEARTLLTAAAERAAA